MPAMNRVILCGNLTRDPELRYTPKGTAVAKIGLAINRKWRDESGAEKEEVTFVDVDAFGKQAEAISQYCKKGKAILVEGRLKLDQWDDKQTGQKRSKLGVVLESCQFLSDGEKRESSSQPAPAPRPPTADTPTGPSTQPPPDDQDDVPFLFVPPQRIQAQILGFSGNKMK